MLANPRVPAADLLLTPAILERGSAIDTAALQKLIEETGVASACPPLATQDADDGFRVICLHDEADAADGWGDAASAPSSSGASGAIGAGGATPSMLPATTRIDPRTGMPLANTADRGRADDIRGEGLFSQAEMDRWRLKLATASSPAERIVVIRSLILAPITQAEKLDVLLQGLSDSDMSVRAETAGLLNEIGINRDISEALAAVNHANSERRLAGMERLRRLVTPSTGDAEVGCITACAAAAVKSGAEPALNGAFLSILAACAASVGRNSARLSELIRIVASMIAESSKHGPSSRQVDEALTAAHRLVRALAVAVPKPLLTILKQERERAADPVTESFLLQHILDLSPATGENEGEDEIIRAAVSYLSRDIDEGRDSRAVGNQLAPGAARAASSRSAPPSKAPPAARKNTPF